MDNYTSISDISFGWKPISQYIVGQHEWVVVNAIDECGNFVKLAAVKRSDGNWYDWFGQIINLKITRFYEAPLISKK